MQVAKHLRFIGTDADGINWIDADNHLNVLLEQTPIFKE